MHKEISRQSNAGVSGGAETYNSNQNGLGETLLSKYKQCSEINERAVINSKNISDLVNHKMASLPKNLYMTQQSPMMQQETGYDFKFDPVNFR